MEKEELDLENAWENDHARDAQHAEKQARRAELANPKLETPPAANSYWHNNCRTGPALADLEGGATVRFWDRTDRYASVSPAGEIKVWHASGQPYDGGQDYSVKHVCEILRAIRNRVDVPPATLNSCLAYLGPEADPTVPQTVNGDASYRTEVVFEKEGRLEIRTPKGTAAFDVVEDEAGGWHLEAVWSAIPIRPQLPPLQARGYANDLTGGEPVS